MTAARVPCVCRLNIRMNYRYVLRQLGLMTFVLSAAVLAAAGYEASEWAGGQPGEFLAGVALLSTFAICVALGACLLAVTRHADVMLGRREALLLVAMSWLMGAALSATPYFIWAHMAGPQGHPFRSFVACYFEAMSGLTTTGASVLRNISDLPQGILLWRSLTHWLGGLGIVVMFVAVLPTLGAGGKKLFQVEAPGPITAGVRPRIRETARVLWLIYLWLTVTLVLLLRWFGGMSWFDAVNHAFATLATGGFSTRNESLGAYNSAVVDYITIGFMILAGVNFGLYYHLFRGRLRMVARDPELRLYLGIIVIATVLVVPSLLSSIIVTSTGVREDGSVLSALRYGLFQVVSIQTTTGFATADSNQWSFMPKAVLFALMFVGGCAGSTGGGLKVIRLLLLIRVIFADIDRAFRPNVIKPVRVGGSVISPEMREGTLVYFAMLIGLFVAGTVLLMLFEADKHIDLVTALSASAATLNNVGPGFGLVGALENYGWFSGPSLVVMSLLMVLGRLEIYAILVLFSFRTFWRGD